MNQLLNILSATPSYSIKNLKNYILLPYKKMRKLLKRLRQATSTATAKLQPLLILCACTHRDYPGCVLLQCFTPEWTGTVSSVRLGLTKTTPCLWDAMKHSLLTKKCLSWFILTQPYSARCIMGKGDGWCCSFGVSAVFNSSLFHSGRLLYSNSCYHSQLSRNY